MAIATYAAFAINLSVAGIALALSLATPYQSAQKVKETKESPLPCPGGWTIYLAIALSGMAALGGEVVWTRLLSLLMGGTVYTFSIILAVFLIGLGIGSSVGAVAARGSPRAALGFCQMFLTLAIAWTAWMISESLPYWPIDLRISESPWYTFQLDLAPLCGPFSCPRRSCGA